VTQGRSILLFGIWLTVAGAGPPVSMASAPADTTAQVTAALTVADPIAREIVQLQDSAFLTQMVSAVMPPDGLLAIGLGGRLGSTVYADGDNLAEVDFQDFLLFIEWNALPWLHLAAELPSRHFSGGPSGFESGFGLRDFVGRLNVGLPGGNWWHWSLFAGANVLTGSSSEGLTESSVSPSTGLAVAFQFWEHARVPELRVHLNAGYRWNRNEQDGYGVGLGQGLQPWFPRYQDSASAGGSSSNNDYLLMAAAIEFRRGTTSLWIEYTTHAMRWDQSVADRENPRILTAALRWGVMTGWALHAAYEVGLHRDDPATAFWPAYPDLVYNLGVSKQFGIGGRDRDADGIADRRDACPEYPEDYDGFEDEDGCPEYDNDHDGVLDAVDLSPFEAEDHDGWFDDDGVPDPDNDGDGILDGDDLCPDVAEDFDGHADGDGCPDELRDRDGDGIDDTDDLCPDHPEDRDGFEDDDGCPDPDNDLDGIDDRDDACPDEPEDYDGDADGDGCPDDAAPDRPASERPEPKRPSSDQRR